MNIYEKLLNIQLELKAPKSQFNSFGNYKYRNCEDILEALKPLLSENKVIILFQDDVKQVGNDNYIMTKLTIINTEKPDEIISTTAIAREDKERKKMDSPQLTGSSSSYARKYALNAMFCIDDTKDSDFTNKGETDKPVKKPVEVNKKDLDKAATDSLRTEIVKTLTEADDPLLEKMLAYLKKKNLGECNYKDLKMIKGRLEEERKKAKAIDNIGKDEIGGIFEQAVN